MKTIKKIGSVVIAAVLLMSLPLTALSAAGPNGIQYPDNSDSSITIHKYAAKSKEGLIHTDHTGQEIGSTDYDPPVYNDGTDDYTLSEVLSDDELKKLITPLGNVTFIIKKGTYNFDTKAFTHDDTWTYPAKLPATGHPDGIEQSRDSNNQPIDGTFFGVTSTAGLLEFPDLPYGVYEITEVPVSGRTIEMNPFYIQVPTYLGGGAALADDWLYDIHVYPKNVEGEVTTKKLDELLSDGTKFVWEFTVPLNPNMDTGKVFKVTDTLDPRLQVLLGSDGKPAAGQVTLWYQDINGVSHKVGDTYGLIYDTDYTLNYIPGATTPTKASDTLVIEFTTAGKTKLKTNAFPTLTADPPEKAELYIQVISYADSTADNTAAMWNTGRTDEGEYHYEIETPPTKPVGDLRILKHKAGDEATHLSGAEFMLFPSLTDAQDGTNAIRVDGDTTVTDPPRDPFIFGPTDSNGVLTIKNLIYGDYWLVEVKAPGGYNLLKDPIEVTVSATSKDVVIKIANNTGFILPTTGGGGTMLFTIAGLGLATAGAVIIIVILQKRKKKDDGGDRKNVSD